VATYDFGDGNGPVGASQTVQGGWVADTASIGPDVIVVGGAAVYNNAVVTGLCTVIGSVYGNAAVAAPVAPPAGIVSGLQQLILVTGQVYGNARVSGMVTVAGRIYGSAEVIGTLGVEIMYVGPDARIYDNAYTNGNGYIDGQVYGNARVLSIGFIDSASSAYDQAEVTGLVYLGSTNVHGNAKLIGASNDLVSDGAFGEYYSEIYLYRADISGNVLMQFLPATPAIPGGSAPSCDGNEGPVTLSGDVTVSGHVYIAGTTVINGSVFIECNTNVPGDEVYIASSTITGAAFSPVRTRQRNSPTRIKQLAGPPSRTRQLVDPFM
jgi:hypothetical protein